MVQGQPAKDGVERSVFERASDASQFNYVHMLPGAYRQPAQYQLSAAQNSPGRKVLLAEVGKISADRGKFQATPESLGEEALGDKAIRLYVSSNHLQDWRNRIRGRKLPICAVEIDCRSVTVCHLGNLAYWNHRHLKWDPKNQQFVGDPEANTWLDRAKRAPWQT